MLSFQQTQGTIPVGVERRFECQSVSLSSLLTHLSNSTATEESVQYIDTPVSYKQEHKHFFFLTKYFSKKT